MIRDGKGAGDIVGRVRALFKRIAPEKTILDINKVFEEIMKLLCSKCISKGVIIETHLTDSLPLIVRDRVQLQQVLFNLFTNGIDAMNSITEHPKKLSVRSAQQDIHTVLAEVRDYGNGLAEPERVFEAFFTTKEKGMGMGSSICSSIVEAHKGNLWAAVPALGPGATSSFTLPLRSGSEQ